MRGLWRFLVVLPVCLLLHGCRIIEAPTEPEEQPTAPATVATTPAQPEAPPSGEPAAPAGPTAAPPAEGEGAATPAEGAAAEQPAEGAAVGEPSEGEGAGQPAAGEQPEGEATAEQPAGEEGATPAAAGETPAEQPEGAEVITPEQGATPAEQPAEGVVLPAGGAATEPVDSAPLLTELRDSTRKAVAETATGLRRVALQQQAEEEQAARLAVRRQGVRAARNHLNHLRAKVGGKDVEQAVFHLALLEHGLDTVRRSLGGGPVVDRMSAALTDLYDPAKIANDDVAVIAGAADQLREALLLLPEAPAEAGEELAPGAADLPQEADAAAPADDETKPAEPEGETLSGEPSGGDLTDQPAPSVKDDPAALAKALAQVLALFDKHQPDTARRRLAALVLELEPADEQLADLVDIVGTACRGIERAVRRGSWRAASWGAARLEQDLDEMATLAGGSGEGAAGGELLDSGSQETTPQPAAPAQPEPAATPSGAKGEGDSE